MKNKRSLAFVLALWVAQIPAWAVDDALPTQQAASPDTASAAFKSEQVMSQIHATNEMEIKVGELARHKGVKSEVRRYGDRLVRDHRFADAKVLDLARRENVTVMPVEPSPEEKEMLGKLQSLSGADFDRAFLKSMAEGHQHAIGLLSLAQARLQDTNLQGLIGKLLPILRQHYHLASDLQG